MKLFPDLLSDTELSKDIPEYFIIGDGACYLSQKVHAFPDVLG